MRRRKKDAFWDMTVVRDQERLDERVAEIEEVDVPMLRQPRALRRAEKVNQTKPRKGRSR
jgi:hypothetical protein